MEYCNYYTMNKSTLGKVLSFLKRPDFKPSDNSVKDKLIQTFQLWSVQSVLILIIGFVIAMSLSLSNWQGINLVESEAQNSIFLFFIAAVVVAPVLEELAFRGWMSYNKLLFPLSTAFLLYMLYGIVNNFLPDTYLINNLALGVFIFSIITLPFTAYYILKKGKNQNILENFLTNNIGKIIYLSSFVFAIVHLGNYTDISKIWFLFPLLILPQFIGGLNLSYIRVKFGLTYSILTHTITNFVPFLFFFIVSFLSEDVKDSYFSQNMSQNVELSLSDQTVFLIMSLIFSVYVLTTVSTSIYSIVKFLQNK